MQATTIRKQLHLGRGGLALALGSLALAATIAVGTLIAVDWSTHDKAVGNAPSTILEHPRANPRFSEMNAPLSMDVRLGSLPNWKLREPNTLTGDTAAIGYTDMLFHELNELPEPALVPPALWWNVDSQ